MSTPRFEAFLAALYVDADLRGRFLADARATASAAGLTASEIDAATRIDATGLELAARSYAGKRRARARHGQRTLMDRIRRIFTRRR
jgi:hypothetical protein